MRKVVIIGNGFDVSHGMRTKYEDFLYNYLVKCLIHSVKNMTQNTREYTYEYKDLLIHLKYNNIEFGNLIRNLVVVKNIYEFVNEYNDFRKLMDELVKRNMIRNLNRKSLLFKIHENERIYNWVDIETEYFDKLKNILFEVLIDSEEEEEREITEIDEVIELNFELDFLKRELIRYLKLILINNNTILSKNEHFTLSSEYEKILFGEFEKKFRKDNILTTNRNPKNRV